MTTIASSAERPRTVTQLRLSPAPAPVPAAADCTDDELLDLAAGAMKGGVRLWDLSYDHVQAICRLLVERVEPAKRLAEEQLAVAVGVGTAIKRALTEERHDHALTTRCLVRELGASIELAKEVEILRGENAMLRAAVKTLGGEDGGQW